MPKIEDNRTWHAMRGEKCLAALESRLSGLDASQAAARLADHGPNRLPEARGKPAWRRLLDQFNNALIYVLLVAGAVTTALGHWVDAGVIFGVVVINAIIGVVQEGRAERSLEAVRRVLSPRAIVVRDGQRREIDAGELVPGDVVQLQSGDRVPADLRLLLVRSLRVDEALLTGESMPVEKTERPSAAPAVLADRTAMAYSGTLVTSGQAQGVVVATGTGTALGQITRLLAGVVPLATPLLRQMDRFGRWLSAAIIVLAGVTFVFGTLVRQGAPGELFLAAVALAVAWIPEGLPAVITITLAVGVQRMARRRAIIRRLPAVETLGAVTVICSDKTGTLTRNEMTVTHVETGAGALQVTGAGYAPRGAFMRDGNAVDPAREPALLRLLQAAVLCTDTGVHRDEDTWRVDGDPTEGALVVAGLKAGVDGQLLAESHPRQDVIPFESEHRFMATLHREADGRGSIVIKGAPEVVLPRCSRVAMDSGDAALEPAHWTQLVDEIARAGQRALAVASLRTNAQQRSLHADDVAGGFMLLGLVGIMDPPRDEAVAAVTRCADAGVKVKMITGDHAGTATAIAAAMGIGTGAVLTGAELDALSPDGLHRAAEDVDVFARVSPEHKLALVSALQDAGHVVAMTGDGVNDAPALKRADVGVAMGLKGTEAAKEAAEMVLADDNFTSIADAVESGRMVYDNIKKSVLFILPTSGGEGLTILAAIALGHTLPVTAAQILWVNMITAVTLALALAFEPRERDVMQRPPRDPAAPILSGFMWWRVALVSLVMVAVAFGLFLLEQSRGSSVEEARTVAVNALVMLEVFYLFATRFLTDSVLSVRGLLGNHYVLISVAVVILMQALFTYLPVMWSLFGSAPLDAGQWLRIAALSSTVLLVVEAEKATLRLVTRLRDGNSRS